MNMKNEEKIYQLNTYNIAEYTSTDYTDNDIAILGDFKNLLFNKYFKLNANIYVVCVKGRLQININTQKYAIYPGEMLICMPNMILSNCTTSSDFKGAMFCLSTQITQKYLHKSSDIWNKAFYISQNPVVRIDKDRVQLFDLYYKVIRARMKQAEQPYYKEVIRSLIRTMLYELLADLNQLSTPPESQMVKRSNILFKRFLDLLACTEVKKRSISYYAGKLCVTPKYLSTVCKNDADIKNLCTAFRLKRRKALPENAENFFYDGGAISVPDLMLFVKEPEKAKKALSATEYGTLALELADKKASPSECERALEEKYYAGLMKVKDDIFGSGKVVAYAILYEKWLCDLRLLLTAKKVGKTI